MNSEFGPNGIHTLQTVWSFSDSSKSDFPFPHLVEYSFNWKLDLDKSLPASGSSVDLDVWVSSALGALWVWGHLRTPVHSYPFYYVNGNGAGIGIFDRLRERAGANALLGRKSVYPSQST